MSQNNLNLKQGDTRPEQPANQLEVYDRAIRPTTSDDYLSQLNLGLGNYSTDEYWQQIESYKQGLYADAAFVRKMLDRAVHETQMRLGMTEWEALDEEEKAEAGDRRRFIRKTGRKKWESLPNESRDGPDKLDALEEHAGISRAWTPPSWQMMEARHETSRSRGARLLDNLFGRVQELRGEGEKTPQGAMTRRGGGRR